MDRITVQVRFSKAIWTCPKCGQEDFEDRNMSGGDSYEHTCSVCSYIFNQSCNQMREYNGSLNYTPEEYEVVKSEDIATAKQILVDKWLYDVKNPPAYVEPTKEELEAELVEKQIELDALQTRINAKEV